MNRKLKHPYKKRFKPVGFDQWAPRVIMGQSIKPNTVVTVTHHWGPFRAIVDSDGNEMSVGRGSLVPVKEGR